MKTTTSAPLSIVFLMSLFLSLFFSSWTACAFATPIDHLQSSTISASRHKPMHQTISKPHSAVPQHPVVSVPHSGPPSTTSHAPTEHKNKKPHKVTAVSSKSIHETGKPRQRRSMKGFNDFLDKLYFTKDFDKMGVLLFK